MRSVLSPSSCRQRRENILKKLYDLRVYTKWKCLTRCSLSFLLKRVERFVGERRQKKSCEKDFTAIPAVVIGVVVSENECGTENAKNESRQQSDVELVKLQSFFIGWKRAPAKEEGEKGEMKNLGMFFALCHSIKVGDGAYHDYTMRGNVCDDGDGRATEMSLNISANFYVLSSQRFLLWEIKILWKWLKVGSWNTENCERKNFKFSTPFFCYVFVHEGNSENPRLNKITTLLRWWEKFDSFKVAKGAVKNSS